MNELTKMVNEINASYSKKESQLFVHQRFNMKMLWSITNVNNDIMKLNMFLKKGKVKIVTFFSNKDNKAALSNNMKLMHTLVNKFVDLRHYVVTDSNKFKINGNNIKSLTINNMKSPTPSLVIINENNSVIFQTYFDGHESNQEIFMIKDYIYALLKK